jgi:PPOX class probable FMN-dependent enzyme
VIAGPIELKGVPSMPDEPWRPALDRALSRNGQSPGCRFVQLATIGLDGRPAARTVVFRGFVGDARDLCFTTDARSAKCAEIARSPEVEICWYFAETREQFRLAGAIRMVDASTPDAPLLAARREVWRTLSEETRASFGWPPPGEPVDPGASIPSAGPDAESPPDTFALMLFSARAVDHLELVGPPQRRWRYAVDANGRWSVREVNP